MEKELPKRKPTRLKEFDYRTNGAYFVTICTKDKQKLLGSVSVGEGLCALPKVALSAIGKEVEKSIGFLGRQDPDITVDHYVVMPNHIHLLIRIQSQGDYGKSSVSKLIGQLKSYTTHVYGKELWQRSFHDHIVRNERSYWALWNYIENNPAKWSEDCFYLP
ncbi:MAG: transposase [Firmicutes bacterium]|nr:transposase [Bacillota bacterium]